MENQLTRKQENLQNIFGVLISSINSLRSKSTTIQDFEFPIITKKNRFLLEILKDYKDIVVDLDDNQAENLRESVGHLVDSINEYNNNSMDASKAEKVINNYNESYLKFINDYSPCLFYFSTFKKINEIEKVKKIHDLLLESDSLHKTAIELERSLQNYQSDLKIESDNLKNDIEKTKAEIQNIEVVTLKKLQDADNLYKEIFDKTITLEVSKFVEPLANEKVVLDKSLETWNNIFWWTVGVSLTVIISLIIYYIVSGNSTVNYNLISLKVTLFVLLLTVVNIANKNIKAIKHNITLNIQRKVSLETYKGFVLSATDDKVKDIMLTKLADTAFGVQSTGYIDNEKDTKSELGITELIGFLKNKG